MAQTGAKAAPKEPPGREIRIEVSLDSKGHIVTNPKSFRVSKCRNEEIVWVCVEKHHHRNGEQPCFTVDFETNGSPFYESQFSSHTAVSGLVRRSVLAGPKRYKYTVRVGDVVDDPDGVVDP